MERLRLIVVIVVIMVAHEWQQQPTRFRTEAGAKATDLDRRFNSFKQNIPHAQ